MILNGGIEVDRIKAKEHLIWLINNKKRFEIRQIRKKRTDSQRKYLHVILSYYALEVGETLEYIKQEVFKKEINPDIFKTTRVNPKTGVVRIDWRSSEALDTKEMTICIDRFRNWSSKNFGIYIPEANEKQFLDHIENEIEKQKQWL